MIVKILSTSIVVGLTLIPSAMIETESCRAQVNKGEAKCLPCKPVSAGGLAYEYHSKAAGNDPHNGMDNHTHHFKMNQSPTTVTPPCKCFWSRDYIKPTEGNSPQSGAVKVQDASGGGVAK
jgi:hypothetical protein